MNKNLMPEVAKLLGVEMGEPFYILENGRHKCIYNGNDLYKITEKGMANINKTDGSYEYHAYWRVILTELLLGEFSVEQLPWEPKYGDKYYTIDFKDDIKPYISWYTWRGFAREYALWKLGVIYQTEDEAYAHMSENYEKLTGKKLSR